MKLFRTQESQAAQAEHLASDALMKGLNASLEEMAMNEAAAFAPSSPTF